MKQQASKQASNQSRQRAGERCYVAVQDVCMARGAWENSGVERIRGWVRFRGGAGSH
jgi:hypothetical protein